MICFVAFQGNNDMPCFLALSQMGSASPEGAGQALFKYAASSIFHREIYLNSNYRRAL